MLKAGTLVRVNVTPPGIRESLPAANWINRAVTVRLLEDAPHAGTLDVIDVESLQPNAPDNLSIYDFNIRHVVYGGKL